MPHETRIVSPGSQPRTVCAVDGTTLRVPSNWELLPPGDAALTRRVKAAGPNWTVQEKRGRKTFSRGVWAPHTTIDSIRQALEDERSTGAYAKRRERDVRRRAGKQEVYVAEFREAVLQFLAFSEMHAGLASQMAAAITSHATPVGSGTVARTQRIPIAQRAESAVIAWMRHQTTAYDDMAIPRVKGMRREVRRELAEQSRKLLQAYRQGRQVSSESCPLQRALAE